MFATYFQGVENRLNGKNTPLSPHLLTSEMKGKNKDKDKETN